MTEDEAKTKACCNGAARPADNGPCIGSACAAWRWSEGLGRTRVHPNVAASWVGWEIADAAPDAQGYVEIIKPQRDGYCGLAGVQVL